MKVYIDGESMTPQLMLKFADGGRHHLVMIYEPPESNFPISTGMMFEAGTTHEAGFVTYDRELSPEEVRNLYGITRESLGLEEECHSPS